MSKVLCIIPARSGSKGIMNKNIIDLNGKPLISYTIEEAVKSKIDKVVVTTDSKKYGEISERFGAIPFLRDKKLANDNIHAIYPVLDCLISIEKLYKYQFDIVITLLPTSPLRKYYHINEALALFLNKSKLSESGIESFDNYSVISVTEGKHPKYSYKIIDNFLIPFLPSASQNFQRQELEPVYEGNGSIFIASSKTLKNYKTFHMKNTYPYIMKKKYSVDINNYFDLELAGLLLRKEKEEDEI